MGASETDPKNRTPASLGSECPGKTWLELSLGDVLKGEGLLVGETQGPRAGGRGAGLKERTGA